MRTIIIDLGATNLRIELDENGQKVKQIAEKTIRSGKSADLSEQINKMIINLTNQKIDQIAVSVCGPVDPQTDLILSLPQLGIENYCLKKVLSKRFGAEVRIVNDANAACLYEAWHGQGKDYSKVLYITLSSGIGGALTVDKKIYGGKGGTALEIGCLPNRKSTFEETCGGLALEKQTGLKNLAPFFAEGAKNPIYRRWLKDLAFNLNIVLVMFDPDILILGGGMLKSSSHFFASLQKAIKKQQKDLRYEYPPIVISEVAQEVPMLGARLLFKTEKVYL